jgi:hypothetical protein
LKIDNIFSKGEGVVTYKTLNIFFSFIPLIHPVFLVAGIIVLSLIKKYDFESDLLKIAVVSYFFYGIFVAGLPFQHYNMLMITFPFLLLIFYPAVTRVINLTEYFRPSLKKYIPYIIFNIQLIIFYLLSTGFFKIYI